MPNTNLKYIITTCSFIFLGIQWGKAQDTSPQQPGPYTINPNNFVRTWSALAPTTDPNVLKSRPVKEVVQTTQYVDGLGRPMQTVIRQGALASGNVPMDMVAPVVYDNYGREKRKYLPFGANAQGGNTSVNDGNFKMNPFQQQQYFYSDNNPGSPVFGQGETFYYSKTEFEASPLNRPDRIYAEGNSWVNQGNGITVKYWKNTADDDVKIWKVQDVANSFGTYSLSTFNNGVYPAGTLYKLVAIDDKGKQVIEFKDKDEKLILKKVQFDDQVTDNGTGKNHTGWLCTYYIYDDVNLLRAVVQPRGVELLALNSWDFSALNGDILNKQCFRNEYDSKNRLITKKVPGTGAIQMVYDARNRLVMMQDALMYTNKEWIVTQYDELNRQMATFKISDPAYYNNAHYHRLNAGGGTAYPDVSSFTNELLSETHYDHYNDLPNNLGFSTNGLLQSGYTTYLTAPVDDFPEPLNLSASKVGLVTWSKTKVLGENKYIINCNLYDEKGRVIQMQTLNYSGEWDVRTSLYDFSGKILVSHLKHKKGGYGHTFEVVTKNHYDALGRLITIEKNINGAGWKKLVAMTYDAVGRLKTKKLSPDFDGTGLEMLAYDYNIRGWLLGGNRDWAKDPNDKTTHYFGFDLGYDKKNIQGLGAYNDASYNGNITGTVWKSQGDNEIRKYDYTYDASNRLTGADFTQYNGAFNNSAGVDFTVSNLTFDANGNIKTMDQKGLTITGSSLIDQLRYTYEENSNRLQNVMDLSNNPQTQLGDFRYTTGHPQKTQKDVYINNPTPANAILVTDYGYDDNGSLTVDNNKGISSIIYNHLNLPRAISVSGKGTITYTYDAAGIKLKKVVEDQSIPGKTITTTTTYFEDFVYESRATTPVAGSDDYSEKLQFLNIEEGRIRYTPPTGGSPEIFMYDFFVKDHLGNIRMVLTEENHTNPYPEVTFEDEAVTNEQTYYENVNLARVLRPNDFYSSNSNGAKVQLLRKNGQAIGTGKLLKVMATDKLQIKVDYFVQDAIGDNSNANGVNSVITQLLTLLNGSAAPASLHGYGSNITSGLSGSADFTSLLQPQVGSGGTAMPKAYLNILFFDEQFKFVAQNSEIVPVTVVGSGQTITRVLQDAKVAPKNGYAYIYVSNESNNFVYFDKFQIIHEQGAILEETHYYPFGLTMAGISSKALNFGMPENKYKFNKGSELQNKEFSDGSGLDWYATSLRTLDPQLGRWWQVDSKPSYDGSPYISMGNNPVLKNDPLGDTTYYYSYKGKYLGRIYTKETAAVIVEKDTEGYVRDHLGDGSIKNKNMKEWVARFAKLGTTYDLKSFSKYYDDNLNSVQAKTIEKGLLLDIV